LVTVVLVSVGVRVTAESVVVVVVEAAGSFTTVVHDESSMPQSGITRTDKDSFFIRLDTNNADSRQRRSVDG
jgi:hypothetical protein